MAGDKKEAKEISALTSTLSGLIVGSVGKLILHPIDTIKAKI